MFYQVNKEVTIFSIISKIKTGNIETHREIHKLLTDGLIILVFSSRCPICDTENLSNTENNNMICRFCGENYIPQFTEEKFRICGEYDNKLLALFK
ncbi:MAG: hypothetical protein ACJAX4_004763 [Clostridium sp.]|jgi:hypothetical protein